MVVDEIEALDLVAHVVPRALTCINGGQESHATLPAP
jgi:hypothetical protein